MNAFLYGTILQWKLDIRSKSLLITCYLVPLLFFFVMGGIFTSIMPEASQTLIQSMTVMGVSMGAFIGLPPSLVEIYGSNMKKMYKANGVPLYLGCVSIYLSTFAHLLIMSAILYMIAPAVFGAAFPENPPLYFASLAVFIAASLSIGSILGLVMKNQAKLTMVSMIFFLPSMLLSGIMFPAELLPDALQTAGKLFPASWGYLLMAGTGSYFDSLWPLAAVFAAGIAICVFLLKKMRQEA